MHLPRWMTVLCKYSIIGTWRLSAAVLTPPVNGVSDLYANLDQCTKDDLLIYKDGGVEIYDEGATKCQPSAPQQTTVPIPILEALLQVLKVGIRLY